ncbi:hypothetical protein ABZZ79_03240 [Streptomyces sp. NPDC006458]|uniref:hypothetical protein n=1 Tax=Streptomyces sp. NPDC006458 TaxID=3154302 RepID=UPI0033AF1DC5
MTDTATRPTEATSLLRRTAQQDIAAAALRLARLGFDTVDRREPPIPSTFRARWSPIGFQDHDATF